MGNNIGAALLVLALAGCASTAPQSDSGASAVSAVGTPFLIAFKIPACVLTVAIAGAIAGASTLAGPPLNIAEEDGPALRRELGDDVVHNCGPPFVVTP